MGSVSPLTGQSILVVEDEPLIALEVAVLLESAGAKVLSARTLADAVGLIGQPGLSAAILDYGLGTEKVSIVCGHLADGHVPFMFYTGYGDLQESFPQAVVVQKPASADTLLTALATLVMTPGEGPVPERAA